MGYAMNVDDDACMREWNVMQCLHETIHTCIINCNIIIKCHL